MIKRKDHTRVTIFAYGLFSRTIYLIVMDFLHPALTVVPTVGSPVMVMESAESRALND